MLVFLFIYKRIFMLTIQEFINTYGKKIPYKINDKKINDAITSEDVIKESICKQYYEHENALLNYGLEFKNNEINVYYSLIKSIEIHLSADILSVTGDTVHIETLANIITYRNNQEYKKTKQKIHPVITVDGNNYSISKNNIIISPNYEFNKRRFIITASYGYNGEVFKTHAVITQNPNIISNWIIINRKSISFESNLNSNLLFPSSGGEYQIRVSELYLNEYVKYDSFKNIIQKQDSQILKDDITNQCDFINGPYYTCAKNIINVNKQPYNSSIREIKISYRYNNRINQIIRLQEAGEALTEEYSLCFSDGILNKKIILKNSNQIDYLIPINAIKKTLVNNKKINEEIINDKILIYNNSNWINCILKKNNIILNISNNTTNDERYCNITFSLNDKNINLYVFQPQPKIIKQDYFIKFQCDDKLNPNNANNYLIKLICYENTYYDNEIIKTKQIVLNEDEIQIQTISSNEKIATVTPFILDLQKGLIGKIKYLEQPHQAINITIIASIKKPNSVEFRKNITISPPDYKTIEVIVSVNNLSNNEIISLNKSMLSITDKSSNTKLQLPTNYFWVNDVMPKDIVFKSDLNFIIGHEYTFEIESYITNNNITTSKHIETYLIEEDDIGIDIDITI